MVDTNSLPVIQNNRIIEIPSQKEFLTKLFNEYLEEAYTSDEFIQSRYEFARSGERFSKRNCKRNGMTANGSNILMDY